jgi:predicted MFS family arabinose efflux permease
MKAKNENSQIIVGIVLSCLGLFVGYGMPFFVGGMMTELGFSQTEANYVSSVEFAGMTIASLLGIFWITKLDWRKVAVFALLAIAIGNLISAYTPSFLVLAVVRFFTALLGHGTAYALGAAILGATSNPDRSFGLSGSIQYVMGSLVALLIPQAMATFGMAGYCIPAMIVAIPALLLNTRLQTVKKSIAEDNKISSTLPFLFLPIAGLLVFVIFQIGHGPRWDNFVPFGASVGLDAADVGIALSIAYGISFIGPLAAAALASRMGRNIPVLLALTVQFFVVISFQGQMEWIGFAVRVIVFQIFWGFGTTFIMGMVANADKTGRYTVLLPAAQSGGLSLALAMSAFFVQGYGPGVISYICAAALVATALAFVLVSRKTVAINNTI